MARPPEPLQSLLSLAVWVVEAEVKEVVAGGSAPPRVTAPPGATSTGQRTPTQTVRLTVSRVLRGEASAEMTVEKPEAGYSLRPGSRGVFLVDATRSILGRYGPDTHPAAAVEAALGLHPVTRPF